MDMKELQKELVGTVKSWQKVENDSIASTSQIIQKSDNPIVHLAMEIIQRDSQMHYRVQEWIADTLENKTVTLNPDELNQIWQMVQRHIELERKMIEEAEKALTAVKDKRTLLVQQFFLNYLLDDERKHNKLLDSLQILPKGMRDTG